MSRAGRAASRLGAALALLCFGGCGAYAPARWPDAGPDAAGEAGASGEIDDEGEEIDGA